MEECLADGKVNGTHRHTSDLCTRQMWMKMDETNVWTFCNDVVQGKYNDFWTQSVENEHSNHVFARSTTTHTVQFHVHLDTRRHTHVHSLHSQLDRSICRQRKKFEFLGHSNFWNVHLDHDEGIFELTQYYQGTTSSWSLKCDAPKAELSTNEN